MGGWAGTPPIREQPSYNDANPPELHGGAPEKITYGHTASNFKIKCEGTEDNGDFAQGEVFSFANACS